MSDPENTQSPVEAPTPAPKAEKASDVFATKEQAAADAKRRATDKGVDWSKYPNKNR